MQTHLRSDESSHSACSQHGGNNRLPVDYIDLLVPERKITPKKMDELCAELRKLAARYPVRIDLRKGVVRGEEENREGDRAEARFPGAEETVVRVVYRRARHADVHFSVDFQKRLADAVQGCDSEQQDG